TARTPTVLAISRWLCSYRIPPTHLLSGNVNMLHPYVVGQSGTERPESVLVTMPPAAIRRTVQAATSFAYRRCPMSAYEALDVTVSTLASFSPSVIGSDWRPSFSCTASML